MRILAITNLYPSPYHPHRGAFNRQQLRALAARNEVAVISPIAWTDELAARRKGAAAIPNARFVPFDGLDVWYPRYLFTPKVLRNWYGHFFRRSIEGAFARALKELQPELVLAAWAYPDGWAAVDLGHQAGLPVVVKVHGSDILTLTKSAGRRRRTAEALCRADHVIAVSQDLADRVAELGVDASRISVVYDGINRDLFHAGPRAEARARLALPAEDPIILFVGNLVPVKGIDVLIEACSRMARRGICSRCFLVGQGPLRTQLQRQIDQCGLTGQVTLVGPVQHDRLPDWYRSADLFVLPSHSEGVPCVLLEAAACQTPYVATRVGGIPEIAHLNVGRLVGPGDAEGLSDAISESLVHPAPTVARDAFPRGHEDAAREIEIIFERVLWAIQQRMPVPA